MKEKFRFKYFTIVVDPEAIKWRKGCDAKIVVPYKFQGVIPYYYLNVSPHKHTIIMSQGVATIKSLKSKIKLNTLRFEECTISSRVHDL